MPPALLKKRNVPLWCAGMRIAQHAPMRRDWEDEAAPQSPGCRLSGRSQRRSAADPRDPSPTASKAKTVYPSARMVASNEKNAAALAGKALSIAGCHPL